MNNYFLRLGAKIDECRRYLLHQGYDYKSADEYVRLVFEETGLKFGLFDYVSTKKIQEAIIHLDKEILGI